MPSKKPTEGFAATKLCWLSAHLPETVKDALAREALSGIKEARCREDHHEKLSGTHRAGSGN